MINQQVWKINKIEAIHEILGRGTLFIIIPIDNGIDFEKKLPINVGDMLLVNDDTYLVNGIESFARAYHYPQEQFGFLIKKIK